MSNEEIQNNKPFADWTWDSIAFRWKPPLIKLNDIYFNSMWSEEKQKWISECILSENKENRGFQIWAAKSVDEESNFNNACSTTEYMIQSVNQITHDATNVDDLVSIKVNNEVKFPIITKHAVVIDLAPVAFITYSECTNETKDVFQSLYSVHPQSATRNIYELFRLIIEWAWCYTDLGNTEPMARLCHDILRIVQMPQDVRNELLGLRPQPISRYIFGDYNALEEYEYDILIPEKFKEWISDIYYNYRPRFPGCPVNVNTSYLPESYPCDII